MIQQCTVCRCDFVPASNDLGRRLADAGVCLTCWREAPPADKVRVAIERDPQIWRSVPMIAGRIERGL